MPFNLILILKRSNDEDVQSHKQDLQRYMIFTKTDAARRSTIRLLLFLSHALRLINSSRSTRFYMSAGRPTCKVQGTLDVERPRSAAPCFFLQRQALTIRCKYIGEYWSNLRYGLKLIHPWHPARF